MQAHNRLCMSEKLKVLLCFHRPKPGGYIGGVVTLCNDYMNKSSLFSSNGIDISCFNYELHKGALLSKIKNSKITNLIYGYKQIKALKHRISEHPHTVIHIHTSRKFLFFKDVLLAYAIRKTCKEKIIMTIHVGDIETVFHNALTRKFLIKLMNRAVDKTLFLSDCMRRQFIEAGLQEERATVLYNFCNVKSVSPHEKIKGHVPNILFLGSINREKGILELLKAANSIESSFHLDICGTVIEESIRSDFERLVSALGDRVYYHGYIGKEKKEELLKRTDILVLPSYREGFPISIIEAMATSCAIITTPVGAIPEVLTADNAIIVPPRDIERLKSSMERLIADNDLRNAMQSANFLASRNFTDKAHIDKLCKIYQ